MANNNPLVKITNNLAYSIDVYDVFNPSTGGTTNLYQYQKLDSIPAGGTKDVQTIREASMLQAMYTGTIKQLNDFYFYQFPIKTMSAVQFSFGSPPPLEFTIESSDKDATIQSFLFQRFAMANPNSALTKNLYAALKKGSPDAINKFFSGTKNFSSCTLSSWNAIMTWLQMFTSGWQGPYYLYEKAPDPLPQDYIPILVATMNIVSTASENSATLKMCTQDADGNPIYASDPQTTTIVMNGDGTMGDKNPGEDVAVNLTPVWMNVIQTTLKDGTPTTQYLAGPIVTGTVASETVVSSQTARQIPNKPADKKKQDLFDASFNNICQGIGLLVGLLMLGDFAKKIFSSAKEKVGEMRKKATSEEEFETEEETIDSESDGEVTSRATTWETTFDNDSSDVDEYYSKTSISIQENVMKKTIDNTANRINEEINEQIENDYTPTQAYEDAVSDLKQSLSDARTKIENGDLDGARKELSDASAKIDQTLEQNGNLMKDWEHASLTESSDALKQAADESDALNTAQEDYNDDMNDEDSSGGEGDDEWSDTDELSD